MVYGVVQQVYGVVTPDSVCMDFEIGVPYVESSALEVIQGLSVQSEASAKCLSHIPLYLTLHKTL